MQLVEMIVSGVVATLFLDVWGRVLHYVFRQPLPNWGRVGRWFVKACGGTFFHHSIDAVPPVANETAIGWVFHYAVGIAYGVVYVWVIRGLLGWEPSLLNGLVFGAISSVVPWFFFQPAMGAGVMGSRTPNPAKATFLAFVAHTLFGLGLAVGALMV